MTYEKTMALLNRLHNKRLEKNEIKPTRIENANDPDLWSYMGETTQNI